MNPKPVPVKTGIKSFDEIDAALLRLGQLETIITKKEAAMNGRIQKIRDEYTQEVVEELKEAVEIKDEIHKFCFDNKSSFDKQRTYSYTHGSVGFSTNPPKVVQLNKKWTVKASIEFLRKLFGGKYIRSKDEINKEEILVDYSQEVETLVDGTKKKDKVLTDSQLAAVGLRIEQDETFSLNINWESIEKSSNK